MFPLKGIQQLLHKSAARIRKILGHFITGGVGIVKAVLLVRRKTMLARERKLNIPEKCSIIAIHEPLHKQALITSTAHSGQPFDGNGSMPLAFLITFIVFPPQATHQVPALAPL